MSKTITPTLQTSHGLEVTSLCTCWKVTRQDATVYGYTDADVDITYEGVTYRAQTGYDATNIDTQNTLNVDTSEIAGVVGTDLTDISLTDVLAGLWDGAEIFIFRLDRSNLNAGGMPLRRGWLGEVSVSNKAFKAELRGMTQILQQTIGRIYTQACDADFGDNRCNKNVAASEGHVIGFGVTDTEFYMYGLSDDDNYYTGGKITWLSGLNTGLSMEVKAYITNSGATSFLTLQMPMPFTVDINDTFRVTPGCDKSFHTCSARWGNQMNFRGFPHIPGMDKLARDAVFADPTD